MHDQQNCIITNTNPMNNMKGPGIFLAQFLRDGPPFSTLEGIIPWAAKLGYKGVQLPVWDERIFDLETAAGSKAYCDDLKGRLAENGVELIELAAYLQGQVMAMHPAYADESDAVVVSASWEALRERGARRVYPAHGPVRWMEAG